MSIFSPRSLKNPVTCAEIAQKFPELISEVIGDPNQLVSGTSSAQDAVETSAVFIATARYLPVALQSAAKTFILPKKLESEIQNAGTQRTLLVSSNVELALAQITNFYFRETPFRNPAVTGVHVTASIGAETTLGTGARIGANAVIGARVRLGTNVYVGANAVVEDDCEIGDDTVIHPLVFVGDRTQIGKRCEINSHSAIGKEGFKYAHTAKGEHVRVPHQGRVVIEDDVHIGSVCAIDRGTFLETRIGAGTKIDNSVHIAHNCSIGKHALITAGFIMAGSSKIGAHFVAGGNSVVTGHIEITDHVHIAGISGVSKSITKAGDYGGYPLQPMRDFLRMKAAIAQLHSMRMQLSKVIKHLGLEAKDGD